MTELSENSDTNMIGFCDRTLRTKDKKTIFKNTQMVCKNNFSFLVYTLEDSKTRSFLSL